MKKTGNTELKKVNRWLVLNKLALNVEKSNFVLFHFTSKTCSRKLKIKIDNKRLNEENHAKFLGVLADPTLSWNPHRTELTKKINKNNWNFLQAEALHS